MRAHHWLLFAVLIVAGYVLGVIYPALGQKVGL